MTLRPAVIGALFQRNFSAYFSGILGYLFILVFVVVGGVVAFSPTFFAANESNLDQLTEWYPLLLLFFVPAITMGVWAEERKSGTDELLFTLPATDLEVLLGKYLAAVAVYSVALIFATSHAAVLAYLGEPDPGLLFATYFGYWAAGSALIGLGMLGSILTSNMAVAFVYGILLCAIPVFVGRVGEFFGYRDRVVDFGLDEQLRAFSMGLINLSAIVYLGSITLVSLYLNYVMITRRHWGVRRGELLPLQYVVRVLSLMVALGCATAWANYSGLFQDTTSERLFSLSEVTHQTLGELKPERAIEIQAFISPEVPQAYVDTRKRLIRMLEQFDRLGGDNLEVRIVETEQYSKQAEEAEQLGILPVRMISDHDGRPHELDVYLGAVVISSYDKVVIPFFGKALPIEYELARSVQTVTREDRPTLGILETEARLTEGGPLSAFVDELRRHYTIKSIAPSADLLEEDIDLLIAALPSSLTDQQMDGLLTYVQAGRPVLVFDDPLPLTLNGQLLRVAPRLPKASAPMMNQRGMPPETKASGGRALRLLSALGLEWGYDQIVFDGYNPHPELNHLSQEYVFVVAGGSAGGGFGPDLPLSRDLDELVMVFPGMVRSTGREGFKVWDLIRSSKLSGIEDWDTIVEGIEEDPIEAMMSGRQPGQMQYRLRAQIDPGKQQIKDENLPLAVRVEGKSDAGSANAIFVADLDLLSTFFVRDRIFGELPMKFDNITFVLNCIDTLLGDESFIGLRSRREASRTLTAIEQRVQAFRVAASNAMRASNEEADKELAKQIEELEQRAKEIEEDESLDSLAKDQLIDQALSTAQVRIDKAKREIEERKQAEIKKTQARNRRQIQSVETQTRFWGVLFASLPATILGLAVFLSRVIAERSQMVPRRHRSIR